MFPKIESLGPESGEWYESMHIIILLLCPSSVRSLPRLVLEFSVISYAFGKLPVALWTWCAMFLCTLSLPYFLFQHWARGYSKSSHPVIHSLLHGLLFMVFQIGVLGFGPTYVVLAYTLAPASRGIVVFEQVKFWVLPDAILRSVKIILVLIVLLLLVLLL